MQNVSVVNLSKMETGDEKRMKQFTYVVTDEIGIHARPAGLLVKEAKQFQSTVMLTCKGKSAAATKLMAVMGMGVKHEMCIRDSLPYRNMHRHSSLPQGFHPSESSLLPDKPMSLRHRPHMQL